MSEEINEKQNRQVMHWLLHSNGITQGEANYRGIARLASRICDLKKAGMKIEKKMVKVTKADGSIRRVAKYFSNDYEFEAKYGKNCPLDGEVCHRQGSCRSCEEWRSEFLSVEDIANGE